MVVVPLVVTVGLLLQVALATSPLQVAQVEPLAVAEKTKRWRKEKNCSLKIVRLYVHAPKSKPFLLQQYFCCPPPLHFQYIRLRKFTQNPFQLIKKNLSLHFIGI